MNAHAPLPNISPVAVTDPKIRRQLQRSGLLFAISRAHWFIAEATRLGKALKSGAMTSDQIDEQLAEMGALDLFTPNLWHVTNDRA